MHPKSSWTLSNWDPAASLVEILKELKWHILVKGPPAHWGQNENNQLYLQDNQLQSRINEHQGCFLGTRMQVISLNSVINWADTCYVLFVNHAQVCPDFWWTCSQVKLISSASHLQIFGNLVTTWLHVMSKSYPTLHQDKEIPWSSCNHSALRNSQEEK